MQLAESQGVRALRAHTAAMRTIGHADDGAGALARQRRLLEALARPQAFPAPDGTAGAAATAMPSAPRVEVIETHISVVMLVGGHAWKLKKAVDLGFLDFSALATRRRLCHEEVRLNRRLAPSLYLDVAVVRGTEDVPVFDDVPDDPPLAPDDAGSGLDYAVRMVRFDQSALLDAQCERGQLSEAQVDAVAVWVAGFHAAAPALGGIDEAALARESSIDAATLATFGSAARVRSDVLDNFAPLRTLPAGVADPAQLDALQRWCTDTLAREASLIDARRAGGFVRECHGDLHLRNIAWIDGTPQVFDCIEFAPALRWTDVCAEIGFLAMDLAARGRPALAARFVDRWLAETGDYGALALLPLYRVYRALVRAKVAAIRAAQPGLGSQDRAAALAEASRYVAHALATSRPTRPALVLTCGLSGSGKSTLAARLVQVLGAVRLRSDVERKRLGGLAPLATSASPVGGGLYGTASTQATYARLAELAAKVVRAGCTAVVDASFLQRADRTAFAGLARTLAVPFAIVEARAPLPVLQARITARTEAGADPSEATAAVLDHQCRVAEPPGADEQPFVIGVDTTAEVDDGWLARLRLLLART